MGFFKKTLKFATVAGVATAGVGALAVAPRSLVRRRAAGSGSMPQVPFAHRGLHDAGSGLSKNYAKTSGDYLATARSYALKAGYGTPNRKSPIAPENSLAAFAAACEAGYGIELDVQLSSDGQVVVLHDADLSRVAGVSRKVAEMTYEELTKIALFPSPSKAGDAVSVAVPEEKWGRAPRGYFQHVPLLSDVLELVHGRVPLIIEYKMGRELNEALMEKADEILRGYTGWYCIESFNPLAVAWYRRNSPDVLRGQLASAPLVSATKIRDQEDLYRWAAGKLLLNWVGRPDFVAYDWHGGNSFQMSAARKLGAIPVAWTIRNEEEYVESSVSFDYFIFESFLPEI